MEPLKRVTHASRHRSRWDAEWRASIRDAVTAGLSLRAVAKAAGVSHVAVLKMLRR